MALAAANEVNQLLMNSAKNEQARLLEIRLKMLSRGASRPKGDALCIFLRSFALMVGSGISMASALRMLGKQSEDLAMGQVACGLADEVTRGNNLSKAMLCYPNAFSDFQVSLVQVGEKTGNLDHLLSRMADYEEKSRMLSMRVKSALSYPACIFVIAMLLLVLGPPYLFAGIFPMLKSMGGNLPLATKILIAFSEGMRNPWLILTVAGALYLIGMMLIRALTIPSMAYWLETQLLTVPVLGKSLQTVAVTRFARSFSIQLGVGCDVMSALKLSAKSAQSHVLNSHIGLAVSAMEGGASISQSLYRTGFFPPTFVSVLQVGEETGEIATMIGRIADLYEMELDSTIDALTAMVEPMIMLMMGLIVGFMLIAIMLPLVQMISNL